MVFSQWDHEVKAFSAERTDDPFTEAVSLGTSRWRFEYAQSPVCNGSVELGRENTIAVMDEKTVVMVRVDGFSQLLQCPRCSGVGCHIAVHNPSGLVFDNHEYVEQPKRCRHDNTEVSGQYRRRMIANKGGPALIATRLLPRAFGHVLAYRTGRNLDPELEQ